MRAAVSMTTCQHHRCRHQPRLHLEGIRKERMEEGGRIRLMNCLPSDEADGDRDQRENHQRNCQPGRIRSATLLETQLLAPAYLPPPSATLTRTIRSRHRDSAPPNLFLNAHGTAPVTERSNV